MQVAYKHKMLVEEIKSEITIKKKKSLDRSIIIFIQRTLLY